MENNSKIRKGNLWIEARVRWKNLDSSQASRHGSPLLLPCYIRRGEERTYLILRRRTFQVPDIRSGAPGGEGNSQAMAETEKEGRDVGRGKTACARDERGQKDGREGRDAKNHDGKGNSQAMVETEREGRDAGREKATCAQDERGSMISEIRSRGLTIFALRSNSN
ncbi:hypothetical protein ACLOJK_036318 [Asimina triloba]